MKSSNLWFLFLFLGVFFTIVSFKEFKILIIKAKFEHLLKNLTQKLNWLLPSLGNLKYSITIFSFPDCSFSEFLFFNSASQVIIIVVLFFFILNLFSSLKCSWVQDKGIFKKWIILTSTLGRVDPRNYPPPAGNPILAAIFEKLIELLLLLLIGGGSPSPRPPKKDDDKDKEDKDKEDKDKEDKDKEEKSEGDKAENDSIGKKNKEPGSYKRKKLKVDISKSIERMKRRAWERNNEDD